jgi:RNA polymerase sigma factor (sigma-70 family)
MAATQLAPVIRLIREIAPPNAIGAPSDGQLLARFTADRDEAAFATLLRRHGPMVLAVCRRVLRDYRAAEDALQATFLVLARKAAALRKLDTLGPWLHGVAYRTALKARTAGMRRRLDQASPGVEPAGRDSADDVVWRDLRPVLDEEVQRLPARYRNAVVLCYLEGRTNAEAAALLDCPRGTIATWLSRARERLRKRLSRRGLALSTGALAAVLTANAAPAALPAALLVPLIKKIVPATMGMSAGGAVSTQVAGLTKGVLNAMFLTKLKVATVALLAVSVAGIGASRLTRAVVAGPADDRGTEPAPPVEGASAPARSASPRQRERRIEIEKKLNSPISLDFKEVPFAQVVDDLRNMCGINIVVADAGIALDRPVTIHLEKVSIRSALSLLLHQLDLGYIVKNEVLVVIPDRGALVRKTYQVADVISPKKGKRNGKTKEDALISLITTSIEPSTWSRQGGRGTIEYYPLGKAIVVSQTPDIQERIAEFLISVRELVNEDRKY